MKIKEVIEILSKRDPEEELIWHDAVEGNDCEVGSFFECKGYEGKGVYVSPLIKQQLKDDYMIITLKGTQQWEPRTDIVLLEEEERML